MDAAEATASQPARSEGLIYVCVESGGDYAKVGWTSSLEHLYARGVDLQVGNPRTLTLRIVGPGDLAAEATLHRTFSDQAVRGEWFRIEGAVADAIARSHPPPGRTGTDRPTGRPPTERKAAQAWLTAQLRVGPLRAGEVFRSAALDGHSVKTVRRAAADLCVIRTPAGGGRRCTWQLP